jgi:hypothetical protein
VNRVLGSECPQCGADVIAPEWSEHVSDHCIRNVWSCDACGRDFDDLVCLPALNMQADGTSVKLGENRLDPPTPHFSGARLKPHFGGRKSLV